MADSWYDKLAKGGYLGDAAKAGVETGRGSWEPHSDQKMQEYHNEFETKQKAREEDMKDKYDKLGAAGM